MKISFFSPKIISITNQWIVLSKFIERKILEIHLFQSGKGIKVKKTCKSAVRAKHKKPIEEEEEETLQHVKKHYFP